MSADKTAESRLISGCIANDRRAQKDLYNLFHAEMSRLCKRYSSTDTLAHEAINAGFLKVFTSLESFDPAKGSLGSWIRTIMMHTCIDLVRKEHAYKSQTRRESQPDEQDLPPEVLSRLSANEILISIRSLPRITQLVFNLYEIDGYAHAEIAALLNICSSTSRWHLTNAKKRLRNLLAPLSQKYKDQKI